MYFETEGVVYNFISYNLQLWLKMSYTSLLGNYITNKCHFAILSSFFSPPLSYPHHAFMLLLRFVRVLFISLLPTLDFPALLKFFICAHYPPLSLYIFELLLLSLPVGSYILIFTELEVYNYRQFVNKGFKSIVEIELYGMVMHHCIIYKDRKT